MFKLTKDILNLQDEVIFSTGEWVEIVPSIDLKYFWVNENPLGNLIKENDFEPIIKNSVFD